MAATIISTAILIIAIVGTQSAVLPSQVFVDAIHGSDSGDGSSSHPLQTMQKTMSILYNNDFPQGGVDVILAEGEYDVSRQSLAFNSSLRSQWDKQLRFAAAPGAQVWLSAGVRVKPTSVQNNVVSIDLRAFGIQDFGKITANTGLGSCPTAGISDGSQGRLEVFVDNLPLTLARYPNINATTGYWQWENIQQVKDPQTAFTFEGDRPKNWLNETDHAFLWGYWAFDWADSVVKLDSIDMDSNTFFISNSTPPTYEFKQKARWLAFNLKAEMDAPGEYFVDDTSGILSFIQPPNFSQNSSIVVSVGAKVLDFDGASNVQFDGINFGFSRGTLISTTSSTNITIANGNATCAGGHGVSLGGKNIIVKNMTISYLGCKGVTLDCGDRNSLAPGYCTVANSSIQHFARFTRTYNPGVGYYCVDCHIDGNIITDAPHAAILGGGNNNVFENNHVENVGFEVDDSGAFYTGRTWTSRGNVIRYNNFRSIRTRVPIFLGSPSVQAIYFDDQMSGFEVYNNTFYDCQVGVFIGGGRRHHVKFNEFELCDTAIHFDDRGLTWQKSYCEPGGTFQQELESVNYMNPPYVTAYPMLANIMEQMPCYPVYNEIVNNVACNCENLFDYNTTALIAWRNILVDNTLSPNPGCVNN